ncbi:MAG: hypothetical protein AELANPGJ_00016 [Anaerolineae bacterium]|nr:hypothetical protein [Anaerolineae bacterium]GIK29397.1 MAG: hypothetical protein BroJett007_25350 [Chloroflexota bacterium]
MLFSLNYSPEMAALIRSGDIEVDRIKCPEWPDMIAEASTVGQVYVHFKLMAGQGLLARELLDSVARFRQETATPYVNTHIGPSSALYPLPSDRSGAKDAVRRSFDQLSEQFGPDAVIAENVPYPARSDNDKSLISIDPEFISEVIEESGVGLLLDIGHARRVAEHWGIDPRIYMSRLPVHRLREIHITGLGYSPEGMRVDHMPMRDEDWDLLGWALDNVQSGNWAEPWSVSCEYGGVGEPFRWRSRADVIAHDAPRMLAMVRAAQPAVTPQTKPTGEA